MQRQNCDYIFLFILDLDLLHTQYPGLLHQINAIKIEYYISFYAANFRTPRSQFFFEKIHNIMMKIISVLLWRYQACEF